MNSNKYRHLWHNYSCDEMTEKVSITLKYQYEIGMIAEDHPTSVHYRLLKSCIGELWLYNAEGDIL